MGLADKIAKKRAEAGQAAGAPVPPGAVPAGASSAPAPAERSQAAVVAERMRADQQDRAAVVLMVSQIEVRAQARTIFEDEPLQDLAEAIRTHGQLQPIVVHQVAPFRYVLLAGERRLRAIRDILQQDTIRATVVDSPDDDLKRRYLQLTENIHREDYDPVELAEELKTLQQMEGLGVRELARKLKISPGWISKKLSLAAADDQIKQAITDGVIAETAYYNDREAAVATVKDAAAGGKPAKTGAVKERAVMVSIPMEVARDLADILKRIAARADHNPVTLGRDATKKDVAAILIARARELKKHA